MDVKRRAFILAFLGIIFSVLAYLLVILSRRYRLVIFIAGMLTGDMVNLLTLGAVICFWICAFMILKYLGEAHLRFKILTRAGTFISTSIAILFVLIIMFFWKLDENKRIVLESPDQEHTIIVTEAFFLHNGGGTFYEKVNSLFIIPIESYSFGDVSYPFTNGEYTVEWLDDEAVIKYLVNPPQGYNQKRLTFQKEDFNNFIRPLSMRTLSHFYGDIHITRCNNTLHHTTNKNLLR